ncbi:uroporphyrinogen-III synthase [uncultured Christiangramia sp.]|uniref:uroporphyrinogen-III synthase n=1 Tax=Christiangramia sp. 3-2217-3z TaxID=3417564 RepID=UPI002612AED4|nr:uroporphyrinogen-III synthase [uncultured Christiangramia sp.]
MPTVISTKKLALNQKELLLNSGIGFAEYDAIEIEFLNFDLPEQTIQNAIFTSKNSLKAITSKQIDITNCFCVGEKTAIMAKEMGYNVLETTAYAHDLANIIIQNYPDREFQFFCGYSRLDKLPEMLQQQNIALKEIKVYKTALNIQQFRSDYDGILFYSPSGVKSYTSKNTINSIAFCIGDTTASEAKRHTTSIVTPGTPGIENLIAMVAKTFRKDLKHQQ